MLHPLLAVKTKASCKDDFRLKNVSNQISLLILLLLALMDKPLPTKVKSEQA
jgi:hypothetical protein